MSPSGCAPARVAASRWRSKTPYRKAGGYSFVAIVPRRMKTMARRKQKRCPECGARALRIELDSGFCEWRKYCDRCGTAWKACGSEEMAVRETRVESYPSP